MTNPPDTTAEMLEHIHAGWDNLQAFVKSLTEAQMTIPKDAAGWSVKDHLMHLAAWENGTLTLLNGQTFHAGLGVDAALLATRDFDRINARIQEDTRDLPLSEVLNHLNEVHTAFVARVAQLSDADLMRPYSSFDPACADNNRPVIGWIENDSFGHYEEHLPWMEAIVRSAQAQSAVENEPLTTQNMLNKIKAEWDELQSFLNGLTEQQMDGPKDAVGWTVKDHLLHISAWESGILAVLNGQSRHEAMGVDAETWATHDDERINALIQRNTRDLPLAEALRQLNTVHANFIARIGQMTDADLLRPYSSFDASAPDQNRPIAAWIVGDSFGHYHDHIPWMAAIAASKA